jgi:two-component system chemotaxis response regulator CheB
MTNMRDPNELRVLVVDDSAFNRRSISEMISDSPGVRVVGKAADGEEALRLLRVMEPDVVTLDLEMPRMDGFTFLRILMSKQPMPVIVVSSYSQKENVFKALELGALDFVAKPDTMSTDVSVVREELLTKIRLARQIKQQSRVLPRPPIDLVPPSRPKATAETAPSRIVVIGSSTGGPSALLEVVSALPKTTRVAVLIAQHMPDKFTRTFAERLDRRSQVTVTEAQHDDTVLAGHVYVCPGRQCMELVRAHGELRVRIVAPGPDDRYVPSADRLFASAAVAGGDTTVGVVLTGMGDDGARGSLALKAQGGRVIAESEASAVVYGMPRAAVRAGGVDRSLNLRGIADYLAAL